MECEMCGGWIGPWPESLVNSPDAYSCSCATDAYKLRTKLEILMAARELLDTEAGHD